MALNVLGQGGSVQGTGLRRSLRTRPPPLRCASGGQGQGASAARHGEPVAGAKPQQALDGGVLPGVQPLLDPVGAVHPGPVPAVRGAPGTGLPPQEIDGMGAWGRPVRRSGRAQSKDTDAAGSFARPPLHTHTFAVAQRIRQTQPPPLPAASTWTSAATWWWALLRPCRASCYRHCCPTRWAAMPTGAPPAGAGPRSARA